MSHLARVPPTLLPALAAGALALFACSKPEPPPPPAETPAPPPAAAASTAVTTPSPASSSAPGTQGLATEEDFEEESASKITPDNLDAQLDALEREIQEE